MHQCAINHAQPFSYLFNRKKFIGIFSKKIQNIVFNFITLCVHFNPLPMPFNKIIAAIKNIFDINFAVF